MRKWKTLESFAGTEEDGGKDLVAAAKRISDPDLRGHIERHAADEIRHAELFRKRATEFGARLTQHGGQEGVSDKAYDLSRGRKGVELDSHGFFNAGLLDELGEVEYVSMLHVAEQRAAFLFEVHRDLNQDDPETVALFDKILKDEKYHVAYTARFLERWRKEGRGREVKKGLRAAKSSRFIGAWKRLGVRSAGGFSRVVLYVLYWTLLAPFGLLSKRQRLASGWQAPKEAATPTAAAGQY